MRNIFIKQLIEEARRDPNLYVLTADLGFRAFEPFRDEFPEQFINVGVAEANMIGIAAGLALAGKRVCVYSIVPFVTLRCLEQIRNNICHHNLNINIIGVGGGFNYGNQGISHNIFEDLAVMRTMPNLTVFCPGDRLEAAVAVKAMINHPGPAYIRLGKAPEKDYHQSIADYKLGDGLVIENGQDLTLISTGNIIDDLALVGEKLKTANHSVRIISFPCIKPINREQIVAAARETKAIFTIEENSIIGGLGGAVAEILMESDFSGIIFKMFALADEAHSDIGSHKYLRAKKGLAADKITDEILKKIRK